ncbi:hypothetical protein LXA43DRAFT_746849 [Ganoderma leucocontextum]|nr:hypothetical protein LXA43DRAFT_746849 [Ganoderma leucocontextum]
MPMEPNMPVVHDVASQVDLMTDEGYSCDCDFESLLLVDATPLNVNIDQSLSHYVTTSFHGPATNKKDDSALTCSAHLLSLETQGSSAFGKARQAVAWHASHPPLRLAHGLYSTFKVQAKLLLPGAALTSCRISLRSPPGHLTHRFCRKENPYAGFVPLRSPSRATGRMSSPGSSPMFLHISVQSIYANTYGDLIIDDQSADGVTAMSPTRFALTCKARE